MLYSVLLFSCAPGRRGKLRSPAQYVAETFYQYSWRELLRLWFALMRSCFLGSWSPLRALIGGGGRELRVECLQGIRGYSEKGRVQRVDRMERAGLWRDSRGEVKVVKEEGGAKETEQKALRGAGLGEVLLPWEATEVPDHSSSDHANHCAIIVGHITSKAGRWDFRKISDRIFSRGFSCSRFSHVPN